MYTHLLENITQQKPEWKAHLVKNTLLMVALVLTEKTVNLWKLKAGVGRQLGNHHTDTRSHYQRIKRWFWQMSEERHSWVELVKAAASLLVGKCSCLILDGTDRRSGPGTEVHWQAGGVTYHFLTLSVLYKKVSVPIWWLDLDRLGVSNQWQRKLLLKTALKVFDLKGKTLLADREYVGVEWFECLRKAGLELVIRLRQSDYLKAVAATGLPVEELERKAKRRMGRINWQPFILAGKLHYYVLVAYWNRNGKIEFLRLISSLPPARAVGLYKQRYRIESMFKHLKSNGFQLQDLNLKTVRKVELLMAVLVLAFTLATVYGLQDFKRKVKLKKHGFPEMSLFRWGLDKWQNHLENLNRFLDKLTHYFHRWLKPNNNLILLHVP